MVQCILAPVNDAQLLVEVPNKKRKKYKFNPEFLKIILKQNDLINLNLFKFSPQVINNKNIKKPVPKAIANRLSAFHRKIQRKGSIVLTFSF